MYSREKTTLVLPGAHEKRQGCPAFSWAPGPTQWPLARVTSVCQGQDGPVRDVKLKTSKGEYNRPISKVVLLLPNTDTTN